MFREVELRLHHGGTFVKKQKFSYLNSEVEIIKIDPDKICYPHLVKYIEEDRYGHISSIYF